MEIIQKKQLLFSTPLKNSKKYVKNGCYSGIFLKTVKTVCFLTILSLTPQLITGLIKKIELF